MFLESLTSGYNTVMRVEFYRSATVGIFSDDRKTSILCDPWLTDGAFLGSWFHDPPLEGFEFEEVLQRKWTFIYISHLHADHFDRKFLSRIVRLQPECKILIPLHGKPWLKRALLSLGFSNNRVIEVTPNIPIEHGDMTISILPADHCNPLVCGAQTPCFSGNDWQRSIDSLAVFNCDGQKIINANDVMATESVPKVFKTIGDCDILLAAYGGAGPYPQCFPDVDEKEIQAKRLANKFIDVVASAAEVLKAKSVMPYAGQYFLGGSLTHLNPSRAVLSLEEVKRRLQTSGIRNVLTPRVFSGIEVSDLAVEWEHREQSIDELDRYLGRISKNKFPYEHMKKSWPSYQNDLEIAADNLRRRYLAVPRTWSKEHSGASFVLKSQLGSAVFDFDQDTLRLEFNKEPRFLYCTTIQVDSRLLQMLVRRRRNYEGFTQAHWNQAEIGSHFMWQRSGPYLPNLHYLFNFLQTA